MYTSSHLTGQISGRSYFLLLCCVAYIQDLGDNSSPQLPPDCSPLAAFLPLRRTVLMILLSLCHISVTFSRPSFLIMYLCKSQGLSVEPKLPPVFFSSMERLSSKNCHIRIPHNNQALLFVSNKIFVFQHLVYRLECLSD